MRRRNNLAHFILASVIVLVLTLLMVYVDAQAQIAFMSHRDGNPEIYVMDINGNNQQNLSNNRHSDHSPSWSADGKRIAFVSNRDGHVIDGRPTNEIYIMDIDGKNQLNLTNNPGDDRSPSWSPDGKRITFVSERDDGEDHSHREIYVMDADGKNQERLTNNHDNDRYPSWSPDGKRIVFSSVREGHFIGEVKITDEIYVMDADGKNQKRLTDNCHDDQYPSWSPDGKRIVFHSNRDGNYEICVMDIDGGNQQRLTNNRHSDHSPSCSPDGKRITFVSHRDGNPEIYVMDTDGKNSRRLTENPNVDQLPSWSPDGKRIAFASNRDGRFNYEIYMIDADGGNLQRLTNNVEGDDDKHPSWSPDGKHIVFSARREGHFENKFAITSEIYVMDADGGNQQRLTENLFDDWYPSWSPDGERIAFSSDRKGDLQNFEIYVMDADGKNQKRLTNNRHQDWEPSWSPDGKRIAFSSNRDRNKDNSHNYEIYVMDTDGGNLQNLTNHRHGDASPAWLNSPFSVFPAGKKFTIWGWVKQVNR